MLEPLVADNGASLVDLEVVGGVRNPILRVLVHRAPAVSVELCKAISKEAADLLEVEDPFPGSFRLEVTSPGLDRPLVSDQDFERATGRLLRVVTKAGRTHKARLKEWDLNTLYLLAKKNQPLAVNRQDVAKATIEVEF